MSAAVISCPKCDTPMRVIRTRADRMLDTIRRRRECDRCGHRASTLETLVVEDDDQIQGATNGAESDQREAHT